MTDDDARADRQERDGAQLAARVRELDRLVVTAICCAIAGILISGLLLPLSTSSGGDSEGSILTAFLTLLENPGQEEGPAVVLLAVGVGALIVLHLLVLVVVLPSIGLGALGGTRRVLCSIVAPLAAVGSGVVLVALIPLVHENDVRIGPGGFVLLAGAVASTVLLSTRMKHPTGPAQVRKAHPRRPGATGSTDSAGPPQHGG